jgi:hypothetical protein
MPVLSKPIPTLSQRLNRECFCITLDRKDLSRRLATEAGDADFWTTHVAGRPNLFSNAPVFLSGDDHAAMRDIVLAIEAAERLPAYQQAALAWAPEIARHDFGPRGAFMGYDFHLGTDGPRLIEINTNAGGAFLNALLAKAQQGCCPEVELAFARSEAGGFEAAVAGMFRREWQLQRGAGTPARIAIVDDAPEEQFLYPEFLLARRLLQRSGTQAEIADASALRFIDGRLLVGNDPIDMVYNRLVDFALARPEHEALRMAYESGAAVVTPNPRSHAVFADKRNLSLLCDRARLKEWGLAAELAKHLAGVPHIELVTHENAERLWQTRKQLFFKPAGGHGSKAVYRGDKVTKTAWAEIVDGGYVAQEFIAPTERMVRIDGKPVPRKMDVRLYAYDGEILLTAARLYQGQTTNMRTPGGGFAPVFIV